MGTLVYGHGDTVVMLDDRTLAHLQFAIGTKLRRNEPFPLTLRGEHLPSGLGSCTLWIAGPIALQFHYHDTRARRQINPEWVEQLIKSASSADGLRIVPEPDRPVVDQSTPTAG